MKAAPKTWAHSVTWAILMYVPAFLASALFFANVHDASTWKLPAIIAGLVSFMTLVAAETKRRA